jgi:hypothetical protein
MGIINIGTGTLAQGQSAYWWWNFNGPPRAPFTAEAVPSNISLNLATQDPRSWG